MGEAPKLAPSDKRRIKAYLKRKGFPEVADLDQLVNTEKKTKGFTKTKIDYPLHVAAWENMADMVWLLLESGANRHLKNSDGKTPYEVAEVGDRQGKVGSH